MKTTLFAVVVGALILAAGCVKTVTGRTTGAVPWGKDTVIGHYQRPVESVFEAALAVIKFNGSLVNESIVHSETNLVKTIEGKVNQRSVWVRVEQREPNVTMVAVQARTQGGGADADLAHELEKQIALKLVR